MAEKMIEDYLQAVSQEMKGIRPVVKKEFLAEIRAHLEDEWAQSEAQDSAALFNMLERFGDPRSIAADFLERNREVQSGSRSSIPTWVIVVTTVLLWPVGIALAWLSPAWRGRDKLFATIFPVLLLAFVLIISFSSYTGSGVVMMSGAATRHDATTFAALVYRLAALLLIASPLLSGIYLAVRSRTA